MKKIIHAVEIKAPSDKVFSAITSESGLSQWWTTNVSVEGKENGRIQFGFMEGMNPIMQVSGWQEGQRVDWHCVDGHDNWRDNTFSFVLNENNGSTMLLFTQNYAQELDDAVYGMYNYNWGYYMDSLRQYCESGQGKPFQASN